MRILVDLDCLVDTRLTLLYKLGIMPENFRDRESDGFFGLSPDEFSRTLTLYNNRLTTISVPTKMFTFIEEYMIEAKASMTTEKLTVTVNLNGAEYTEGLQELLHNHFSFKGYTLDVIDIDMTIKDFDNFEVYIGYNAVSKLSEWLGNGSLFASPIIEKVIIAPDLLVGEVKDRVNAVKLLKEQFSAFTIMELLEVGAFSAI